MAKTKMNTQQNKAEAVKAEMPKQAQAPEATTSVQAESTEIKALEVKGLTYEIGFALLQFGKLIEHEIVEVTATDESTAFSLANEKLTQKHKNAIEGNGAQIVYTGKFTIIK